MALSPRRPPARLRRRRREGRRPPLRAFVRCRQRAACSRYRGRAIPVLVSGRKIHRLFRGRPPHAGDARAGGPLQTICTAADGRGGAWSSRDVIVFAPAIRLPLHRVSALGGTPSPGHDFRREGLHAPVADVPPGRSPLPLSLPERRPEHAPARVSRRSTLLRTHFSSRPAGGRTMTREGCSYAREKALFSQPFDASRRLLSGEPTLVVDGIIPEGEAGWTGLASFSSAGNGTLVYRRRTNPRQRLTWVRPFRKNRRHGRGSRASGGALLVSRGAADRNRRGRPAHGAPGSLAGRPHPRHVDAPHVRTQGEHHRTRLARRRLALFQVDRRRAAWA